MGEDPALSTMTIETGCYYIVNVAHKNRVFLPDSTQGTPLQASYGKGLPGERWTVTLHSNERYSIENIGEPTCFANGRASKVDNSVAGRGNRQLWIIEETSVKGNYRIGLSGLTSVWALLDAEDGTPITLDSAIANRQTWWTFKYVEEIADSPPAMTQITLFELASPPSSPALPLKLDFLIIQEMSKAPIPSIFVAIDEVCLPLGAEVQTQTPRMNLIEFKSFGSKKTYFQRFSCFVTSEELLNVQGSNLSWRPCFTNIPTWLKEMVSDFRADSMKVVVLNLNSIAFWNDVIIVDLISHLVEQGAHMILTLTQSTLGENLYSSDLFEKLCGLSSNVHDDLKKGGFSDHVGSYIVRAPGLMEEKRAAEKRRIEEERLEGERLMEEKRIAEARRLVEIPRHAEAPRMAEKRPAEQTKPIESGCYVITNFKAKNSAFLHDSRDGTVLTANRGYDVPDEQWEVTRLNNGRYSIRSVNQGSFAFGGSRASLGDYVEGRSRIQIWIIEETCFSGLYTIGSSDTTMFWALLDDEHDTPITQHNVDIDSRTWWTFTSPRKEAVATDNAIYADDTRLTKKRLAEQTGPMKPGRYLITNVATKNLAFHKGGYETSITASYGQAVPGEQWEVASFGTEWLIKEVNYKGYGLFADASDRLGDHVEMRQYRMGWTIQQTCIKGQYTIGCRDNTLFWGLPDEEYETPIMLDSDANNLRTWWTFTPLLEKSPT